MTDQELNARVAGMLGWRKEPCTCGLAVCDRKPVWQRHVGDDVVERRFDDWDLPDFAGSMDAIRMAVETLSGAEREAFADALLEVLGLDDGEWVTASTVSMLLATPRQWALAYLSMLEATRR